MSAAFTKGPWHVEAGMENHPRFGIITEKNIILARAWVEPDANLIAAAPDLYQALDAAAQELFPRGVVLAGQRALVEQVTAALAKARGEQS